VFIYSPQHKKIAEFIKNDPCFYMPLILKAMCRSIIHGCFLFLFFMATSSRIMHLVTNLK